MCWGRPLSYPTPTLTHLRHPPLYPTEKTLQWRDDDDDPVATIPLASLEAVMAPGKHEVELQFVLDDSATRGDDVVSNLRFFVPPDHELAAEAMEGMDAAATLATKIRAAAGLSSVSGELVAEIPGADTMFLVPRGRFSINLYMTFLRLEGNTNSYKISYKNLARCTYLPRPNPAGDAATRFLLVLSLNQPLRQGQQSYAHLVMQVDNNPHECTLQVAEETRAESFPKLPPVVSGDRPKVIAQLIRHIAGVPVYRPKNFESKLKFKCVRCSYKSSEGLLYPLDGSLMFVHKPTLFIQYGEISQMIFQRVNASNVNASFDVEVHLKAAGSTSKVYTFGQVEGRERDILQQYFIAAGINVQINTTGNANAAAVASAIDAEMAGSEDGFGEDSEDSEDSEFDYGGPTGRSDDSASSGEEDGDDDDAGAAGSPAQAGTKRRRAGDAKESVLAADGGDDDDDDE